jgi:hypothetical protein
MKATMQLGPNERCHCGSGLKYKKCCRAKDETVERQPAGPVARPVFLRSDIIGEPFLTCCRCGHDTFGIYLSVGSGDHYTRECSTCGYHEERQLPPTQKAIIYLDQFVISNLAKLLDDTAAGHNTVAADSFWLALYEKASLVLGLQLAVFPDSEFHSVESLISTDPPYEVLRDVYEHLSNGVTFFDRAATERFQLLPLFKRWLDPAVSERPIAREHLMHGKPHEWSGQFQVSVAIPYREEEIDQIVAGRERAHAAFSETFVAWQAEPKTLEASMEDEAAAFGRTILQAYVDHVRRQAEVARRYAEEYAATGTSNLRFDDVLPSGAASLTGHLMRVAGDHGYAGREAFAKVAEFLASPELRSAPSIRLSTLLFAALARKAGLGQRRMPSEGVFTDVNAIASLLPYVDALFIDREMAGLLRDEPLQTVVASYGARVFSPSNRAEFLEYLDQIANSASAEHLETARDYYGPGAGRPYMSLVANRRASRIRLSTEG